LGCFMWITVTLLPGYLVGLLSDTESNYILFSNSYGVQVQARYN